VFICILYCSFEYRLRVALGPGGDLMLTSRIRNTNAEGKAFSFTFAYHTYFSVSDIRYVCLALIMDTIFEIFNLEFFPYFDLFIINILQMNPRKIYFQIWPFSIAQVHLA
jgi:hypothetical protein